MPHDFGPMMRTLTRADGFGEGIVYLKASGETRSIQAAVHRMPAPTIPTDPDQRTIKARVHVEDDADFGISSAELDVAQDKLRLEPILGGGVRDLPILRQCESVLGLLVLEV